MKKTIWILMIINLKDQVLMQMMKEKKMKMMMIIIIIKIYKDRFQN